MHPAVWPKRCLACVQHVSLFLSNSGCDPPCLRSAVADSPEATPKVVEGCQILPEVWVQPAQRWRASWRGARETGMPGTGFGTSESVSHDLARFKHATLAAGDLALSKLTSRWGVSATVSSSMQSW